MKMTELEAAKSAIDGAKYCANTAGEIAVVEKKVISDEEVLIRVQLAHTDDVYADMSDPATRDAALQLLTAMRQRFERRQKEYEKRAVECLIGAPESTDTANG